MAQKNKPKSLPEPTEQERFFYAVIQRHKSRVAQQRREWAIHSAMYRGDAMAQWDGTDDTVMEDLEEAGAEDITGEANYLYAFVDTQAAQVVPNNPMCDVRASRTALVKKAKYRTALINEVFKLEKMHAKLWKLVSRGIVYPRSFMKVSWNNKKNRPVLRVRSPHVVWFDDTADEWEDVRYMVELQALTIGEFRARIKSSKHKDDLKRVYDEKVAAFVEGSAGYPDLMRDEDQALPKRRDSTAMDSYRWVQIYEVYDFVGKRFYHFAEGVSKPLFSSALPYKRFENPFVPLVFNDNLRDIGGLSDAKLVAPTIQRLNEMAALRIWHAKSSIPAVVLHGGLVDDPSEFEDAYESLDGPGQYLLLEAVARAGIDQVMGQTPVPQLPIEWQPTMDSLQQTIEFVLALPAIARGQVGQSDVATELALADSATKTRNGRRQQAVYDVMAHVGEIIVHLYSEFMEDEQYISAEVGDDFGPDVMLTRESMGLRREGDSPWAYRYKAHPYDGKRDNSVVQLKAILETVNLLFGNPDIDQRKFTEKLLELLSLGDLLLDPQQAQQQQAAMAAAAAEGGGGGGAAVADLAQMAAMPPEMMGPASGGQLGAGMEAQTVPSGTSGGTVPVVG